VCWTNKHILSILLMHLHTNTHTHTHTHTHTSRQKTIHRQATYTPLYCLHLLRQIYSMDTTAYHVQHTGILASNLGKRLCNLKSDLPPLLSFPSGVIQWTRS